MSLLTKPDIASSDQNSAVLRYLLQHEPSDAIVVGGSWLLQALSRLLAPGKGEDGAHLVRLRVKGVGTFARLVLQIADKSKSYGGVAQLECVRNRKPDAGARAENIDMRVDLKSLQHLVEYFFKAFGGTNAVLDMMPSSPVFPRPYLRLRYEAEGKDGYLAQVFLIGTP